MLHWQWMNLTNTTSLRVEIKKIWQKTTYFKYFWHSVIPAIFSLSTDDFAVVI